MIVTLSQKGPLAIPPEVCEAAGFEPGDNFELVLVPGGLLLMPTRTDEEMEAFWGPNWREDLERSLTDAAEGRTTFYESTDEFLAALEARQHADVRSG